MNHRNDAEVEAGQSVRACLERARGLLLLSREARFDQNGARCSVVIKDTKEIVRPSVSVKSQRAGMYGMATLRVAHQTVPNQQGFGVSWRHPDCFGTAWL